MHTPQAHTTLEAAVRGSLWAAALPVDELDRVVAETRERRIPAGGYAMRCGDAAEHWVGVIEGLVKMCVTHEDGRQCILTAMTAGGWAGEGSLLQPGAWRYDAVAVRHCRLACVPRPTFERLVRTHLAFNHFLLSHLNARLGMFIGLAEFDRLLGPEARVARCLASLFDPRLYPRATPFVQLSQEEVGLLAAISRQRAHDALHALQRDGLLRVDFGGVTVLDLTRLRAYTGGGHPPRGEAKAA